MSSTNRKKELSRRMRVRFWILTLICFAVITLLSLGFYLVYYNIPFPETDSMNPEAEALAEEIDAIKLGNNNQKELERMNSAYRGLSSRQKSQITKERYEKLQEAMMLEKHLEETGEGFTVLDKSKNGFDLNLSLDADMRLKHSDGRTVFEGQVALNGAAEQKAFDSLLCGNRSFTIEAEINPNGFGYNRGEMNMIASKGDNCMAVRISNQTVYFYIKNTQGEWIGEEQQLSRAQMNDWIHIAAIYDGSNITVYLEGSRPKTTQNAGTFCASGYPFSIGFCPETGRGSECSIRSIRVYDQALAEEELDQGVYGPDHESVVLWYDYGDYICPELDTEAKGIRSYVSLVKAVPGEKIRLRAEPVPFYASGTVLYQSDSEDVAAVSEDGVLTAFAPGTAMLSARIAGTDIRTEFQVTVKVSFFSLRSAADWIAGRLLWIAALCLALCMIGIVLVQRRQMICCLAGLSDAVASIGESNGEAKLPPVLGDMQTMLLAKEDSFRQKEAAIRDVEKKKNDMVVYLAHDLKTPIASLIGYLTLMEAEPEISPKLQRRYTKIALKSAYRLNDLIDEFFEIARFNISHMALAYSEINLTKLLEQMVSEFEPLFAKKGLTCRLDVPEHVMLACDADKLVRVFDNLLKNAINYSFHNTEILIAVSEGDTVVFTCTNHGKTIPAEKLAHLFEQFFRLDSARSPETGGLGLGLAIARQIVEAHHGEICAESQNDEICFTVTLPRER